MLFSQSVSLLKSSNSASVKTFFKKHILLLLLLFSASSLYAQQIQQEPEGELTFTVASLSPASGGPGTVVTLSGAGFTSGVTAVEFGGVAATSFTYVSQYTVTAVVGAGASGLVTMTIPGELEIPTTQPQFTFTVPVAPTINSFSPSDGIDGSIIIIDGHSFTGATTVNFGVDTAASFTVVSDSVISAVVGNGASGNISVTVPSAGTATLAGFTYGCSWTGATSSAWENPTNWSCGVVPDSTTDVVIGSGTVLLSNNATVKSLTLNPTVNFTIASGYNLTILH